MKGPKQVDGSRIKASGERKGNAAGLPLDEPHAGSKTVGERLKAFEQLMTAVNGGSLADVKKAVAEGVDLKAKDEQGRTPLQVAEFELAQADNKLDDAMTPRIGGVVEVCAIIVEDRKNPPAKQAKAPHKSPAKRLEEAMEEVSARRAIVEFLKQSGAE